MKIFNKGGHRQLSKVEKRVAKIGTSDLITYVETTMFSIGKNIAGTGSKSIENYVDAEEQAEALLAIIRELKKRESNG